MNEEDFGEVDLEGRSGPQPVWRPHHNSSVGIIAKQIDAIGRERVGLVVILGGCSQTQNSCGAVVCARQCIIEHIKHPTGSLKATQLNTIQSATL